MTEYILDSRRLMTRSEAHEYLKEALGLPDYYGKNLDALHDCLGEMRGRIIIENSEVLKESYSYGARVLKVMRDATRENGGLEVVMG